MQHASDGLKFFDPRFDLGPAKGTQARNHCLYQSGYGSKRVPVRIDGDPESEDVLCHEIDPVLRLLQSNLEALGLPLPPIEDEWGPGECEITFSPLTAMKAADSSLLFSRRSKQICRRHGYHATFMAHPQVANVFPSGWHMHQSIRRISDKTNVFMAEDGTGPLSAYGMNYVGGVLQHAAGTSMMTTPTINGYKRQRPDGFAPFKAGWALENRGAMVRVIGGPGDPASRIENRIGEPTANPYLYIASQLIAGLDGVATKKDPGAPALAAYLADAPVLPRSLMEAIEGFRNDAVIREAVEEFLELHGHAEGV